MLLKFSLFAVNPQHLKIVQLNATSVKASTYLFSYSQKQDENLW